MKKDKLTTVLLLIILVAGLSLLLYPSFSNYWNSMHATQTISQYNKEIATITSDESKKLWQDAVEYNIELYEHGSTFSVDEAMQKKYESLLNVGGSGVMGYIEIERIGVSLPIYHGTDEATLQVAVGHGEWSSLPVGGPSTHSVLSGHRGLPSAKLFTDLDELREGDIFTLVILNTTLTYEIDQIRTVLPSDVQDLVISEGKDYCTLVTCTPYGINTHRLLVRGHRIETRKTSNVRIVSEAVIVEPLVVAPIIAFPILLALLIMVLTKRPKRKVQIKNKNLYRR